MIHTVYSNSYEVLRAVLLSNIEHLGFGGQAAQRDASDFDALCAKVFERVPVIIPSRAVQTDLERAIAKQNAVCAAMDFMYLSQWMGFFSKEPLANVVGNEADWMIWRILCEEGPGSFRAAVREADPSSRLERYLEGRSSEEIFALARHISSVFVAYATYRVDWLFDWLGIHRELVPQGAEALDERRRLKTHPDYLWQRMLWVRLAQEPNWQGKAFLSALPQSLAALAQAPKHLKRLEVGPGRWAPLPDALHIFAPFVVPPLMLSIIKAYAHAGRDVWFYLLNPCSEYWFDLVPQRLFDWRRADGEGTGDDHREVGHPILADNGLSVRANIDRLWRFTQGADTGLETPELRLSELDPPSSGEPGVPFARRIETYEAFSRRLFGDFRNMHAQTEAAAQSYYLEAREPTLLRRVQDSILLLEPDLEKLASESAPLFQKDDRSIHFVAAPTATRELEALADWLQAQFEADPTLRPDDVLVVTPDITATSPLIEKVFGSLAEGARIEFRITGAQSAAADAPAQALSDLIALVSGRARREAFTSWLALPPVAERFGLSVEDIGTISAWLAAAGYRFGLSDAHLEAIDPVTFANVRDTTLARALERLSFGLALPDAIDAPWGDILPVREGESSWVRVADRPALLETLCEIAGKLEKLREAARLEATQCAVEPAQWSAWIADALEALFAPETPENSYGPIRAAADSVRAEIEAAATAGALEAGLPVPFSLFMKVFLERLGEETVSGRPGNAVTFAGMSAMRGLPYKVLAVIGLNHDCSFPGTMRFEEFDLMGAAPRRGDRDSRVDNRNVFLDLLLAARKTFLVSYVSGTNEADQKEPSIVAAELRDWLLSFAHGREARRAAQAQLTTRLSLNSFSKANFSSASGDWQSTDKALLAAVADAEAAAYAASEACFADAGIARARPVEVVDFDDLWRFWRRSADWALKESGIVLPESGATDSVSLIPSREPLDAWKRKHFAYEYLREGRSREEIERRWGCDPTKGTAGVREWALKDEIDFAEQLAERVAAREAELTPLEDERIVVKLPAAATPEKRPVRIAVRLTSLFAAVHALEFETTEPSLQKTEKASKAKAPLDASERLRVCASVSSESGSTIERRFVEHLFACAAGRPVATEVFHRGETKKGSSKTGEAVPVECTQFPFVSAKAAKRFAAALYALYSCAFERAAQLPDRSRAGDVTEERADELLFRGADLDAARRARGELEDALAGMMKACGTPECEARIEDFVRAQKTVAARSRRSQE